MQAHVFDIYKGTTHDGPGIRDTVFLKGCPLKCKWCHNPEGIDFENGVWYEKEYCIGCEECVKVCKNKAVTTEEDGVHIDYSACRKCMKCADYCPTKAITKIAESYTVEELAAEILKDKEYFNISGGGVTVSGGEAMMRWDFVKEFFRVMKMNNINTALDTSGFCRKEELKAVLEYTDILLYDLKVVNHKLHKEWTGVENSVILQNLLYIKDYVSKNGLKLWIRTPIIPRFTNNTEVINEIAVFIKNNLNDCIERWELCAFNNSCVSKYKKLNMNWTLKNESIISQENMLILLEVAKKSQIKEIIYSGITKKEF